MWVERDNANRFKVKMTSIGRSEQKTAVFIHHLQRVSVEGRKSGAGKKYNSLPPLTSPLSSVKEQFLMVLDVYKLHNGWSQMDKSLQYINYIIVLLPKP